MRPGRPPAARRHSQIQVCTGTESPVSPSCASELEGPVLRAAGPRLGGTWMGPGPGQAELPGLSPGYPVCTHVQGHCIRINSELRGPGPGPPEFRSHSPPRQCLCRAAPESLTPAAVPPPRRSPAVPRLSAATGDRARVTGRAGQPPAPSSHPCPARPGPAWAGARPGGRPKRVARGRATRMLTARQSEARRTSGSMPAARAGPQC